MQQVNLDAMLARFTEHWSPKKIAQVNDYDVRIVKVQGEFTWHQHPDTDEFFLVLSGQLTIQMRDRDVVLAPGELFVVPQGIEHCLDGCGVGQVHAVDGPAAVLAASARSSPTPK
jgi:mannose-6-phosphate isomerase-like protein (cupin superfamily)